MKKIFGIILWTATILQAQYNVNGINQSPYVSYLFSYNFTYDSFADSLFARMSPTPSLLDKLLMNNFILTMRVNNLLYWCDVEYMLCNKDSVNQRLNWKKPAHNLTNSNGRWGADTGWTGNGSNSVLNTNYNLSTDKINWTRDSGTIIYYSNSITYRNGGDADFGAQGGFKWHQLWSGNKYYVSTGDGDFNQYFSTTPLAYGLFALVVSDSTRLYNYNQTAYYKSVLPKELYGATNSNMGIGAILTGSTPSYSSARSYQYFAIGKVLNQAQIEIIYNALIKYFEGKKTIFGGINIVCVGNSLTYGTSSTNDSNYVSLLAGKLGSGYTVYNRGHWGETDSGLYDRYTAEVKTLIHPYKTNWYILWEGTNALCHNSSPDTCLARENRNISRAKSDGFNKTVHVTLMNGAGTITGFNDLRKALNVLIRNGSTADYVFDIGNDPVLGCDECNSDFTKFNYADALHLINPGYDYFSTKMENTYF